MTHYKVHKLSFHFMCYLTAFDMFMFPGNAIETVLVGTLLPVLPAY